MVQIVTIRYDRSAGAGGKTRPHYLPGGSGRPPNRCLVHAPATYAPRCRTIGRGGVWGWEGDFGVEHCMARSGFHG